MWQRQTLLGLNPAQQRDSGAKERCAESPRRRAINSAQTRTREEKSCSPGFTKAAQSYRNVIKNEGENFLESWSRYPGVRGGDLLKTHAQIKGLFQSFLYIHT